MSPHSSTADCPVVFLSLGPGSPDLLTARAIACLQSADVVLVPATRSGDGGLYSRASATAGFWCDESRLRVYELPMKADRQAARAVYDAIYTDVIRLHAEGRRVVIAVEGDASIYASIHYVMDRLAADGLPVEQLAGIPSFIAAAARAGLSLVSGTGRLIVMPGDAEAEELQQLLASRYTVVVMKLSRCADAVTAVLRANDEVTCHYFENIDTADEFYTTERAVIIDRPKPYFSLCILCSR